MVVRGSGVKSGFTVSEAAGRPNEDPGRAARLPEVDFLKAAGIIVIPLIHSLRALWDPNVSSVERWLLFATRFAVPSFLFVSGYLVAGEQVSLGRIGARLRRLVVPYAIATIAAEVFFAAHGRPVTVGSAALDLLFGSALGPYYYVFIAVILTLAWPLVAAGGLPVVALLMGVSLVSQLATVAPTPKAAGAPWSGSQTA